MFQSRVYTPNQLSIPSGFVCCISISPIIYRDNATIFVTWNITKTLTVSSVILFTDTVTLERLALFLYLYQFIGFTTDFNRTGLPMSLHFAL